MNDGKCLLAFDILNSSKTAQQFAKFKVLGLGSC